MTETGPNPLDTRVLELCNERDFNQAATVILEALGADVVRVMHARFRDESTTGEVFSRFAEDLWVGLPGFGFRCSVRAWVFALARNAGNRYLAREVRRQRRAVPLSDAVVPRVELERVRTATLAHLRTENRDQLVALRSELSDDDQLLLTLRIDGRLDWKEVAVVILGDADANAERVAREASRLRKRFQLVKDRLRRRAVEVGLISASGSTRDR